MSREAAAAFLATVAADANVRTELEAHLEGATDEVGSFVEFAAQKGLGFTPAELGEALEGGDELSEEQLDRVAGGFNPQPEPPAAYLDYIRTRYRDLLAPSLSRRGIRLGR